MCNLSVIPDEQSVQLDSRNNTAINQDGHRETQSKFFRINCVR